MSEETSVVGTETEEPKAAPAAADAQDVDIDAYLKEFEDADTPKSEPEQDTKIDQRVETLERQIANQQYRTDMDETIRSIRGDVDAEFFSDDLVEGWLNAQANRDPRVGHAFMKRHENPVAYKKVVSALAGQFQKRFKELPDRNITEDREAVASAVRGASKPAPETDDFDTAEILKLAETNPTAFKAWQKEQSAKMKR